MPDLTFNIALGREVELYRRVDANDPADSALLMVILALAGIDDDSVLKDMDDLATILATSPEATNTGYSRKTLTDAALSAVSVDDVRDRTILTIPSQTFATISAGDTWEKALICYDPDTTGGTDSSVIPITAHALRYQGAAVIPNGSNIVVDLSAGFCQVQ